MHPAPPLVATPLRCRPPSEGPPNGMGTKGSEGCTSHSSPDTTTSLEADGDTDSSSRLHIPPSNAIQGEESLKENGGSGGNTTRHMIYWHHQQGEHRWSRGAGRVHSPNHDTT
ncbi:hypothetical protein PVAP13_4NG071100 [Panicum virgatum]|uniref:Uncharacterized protein n=1 Tax=Panicum virgatum TaxID=38727 RepID=A0A8T0T0Y3_PANVG|nr:hypothetical protein PVAP13_4NG071100 [Panicum virgatum]